MPGFSTSRLGLVLAVLLLLGTIPAARAADPGLRIGGTGAAVALMNHLGARFAAQVPDIQVDVLPSLGSSGGIRALADGVIDLAVSARPLKPAETAQGLTATPFLRTPFVIVTSLREPPPLPSHGLAVLYRDPSARWADGTPVHVILRPRSDSDSAALAHYFYGMAEALDAARKRPEVPVAPTDQDNIRLAGEISGSLTAATLVQIVSEFADVQPIPLDGVVPSVTAMHEGRYPYMKELILVHRADRGEAVDRFIAFLASAPGHRLLREAGGLPLL